MVPQNIKPVLQRTAIEVSLALGWGGSLAPSVPGPGFAWGLGPFQLLASLCVPRSWHGAYGT